VAAELAVDVTVTGVLVEAVPLKGPFWGALEMVVKLKTTPPVI